MELSRRTFIKTGLAGAALAAYGALPFTWPDDEALAKEVWTTLERTVMPVPVPSTAPIVLPTDTGKFAQYGYGVWQYGPGIKAEKRLELMPASYTASGVSKSSRLLRFFTITDIHITDKESPAQIILLGLKLAISSAYSPVMPYTTHVLEAAVRTVNELHKQDPIDFGISLGDCCNSTQYNELRWYIDILDGKPITPSSGAHAGADTVDYQKPFQAAGLDASIPWYQALGNHDHFWIGTAPVNDYLRRTYVGEEVLNLGNFLTEGMDSRGFYMGTLNGASPNADIIDMGPTSAFATPPKVVADAKRRSLLRSQWMAEFFQTSSKPVGHGFSQANVDADFASYSFEPKADVPLKVIVLDNTQDEKDTQGGGFTWHGTVDEKRWTWLIGELDAGQAQGKLMILAMHVPIGVEKADSNVSWWAHAFVSEAQLFAKLHEYPNLIAVIAGHRHVNVIAPFPSPDPTRPELGFWQIETASLRDFPQQFRTFDLVVNSDNTLSIFTTNVSPAVEDGSPAAKSRAFSIAAMQTIKNADVPSNPGSLLPTGSCNAELVVPLTAQMQKKLHQLAAQKAV